MTKILTFPTPTTPKNERRLHAFFPSMNKQSDLADYRSQTEGHFQTVEVAKTILLNDADFRALSSDLLSNDERFAGMGGHDTDADVPSVDFFKLTEEQQEAWKEGAYVCNAVLVCNTENADAFVIDPQGYGYARYVGLIDVSEAEIKERAEAKRAAELEAKREEIAKRRAAADEAATHLKFEIGKTYYDRSACDHDCIYSFEVVGRTPKFVKLRKLSGGDVYSKKIHTNDRGQEYCYPNGVYSMCSIIDSSDFVLK